MKKIKLVYILGLILALEISSYAQFNKTVDYSGLYRMNGTYNNLSGEVLKDDSLSERRSSTAYALFDFGINVNPFKELKVSTILRARSDLGAFFGLGNMISFRQIRVEGNLAKVIKYEIGDIDVGMTKYTLYNPDEINKDYESEALRMRRDIVDYENFNYGNKWRMQGGQFESALLFGKYIEKIKAKLILTRVKKSNDITIPDRFVIGSKVSIVQSKYLQLGVNYVTMFDNVGTALDTAYKFSNNVLTGDYKLTFEGNKLLVNLYGEMGPSSFKYDSLTVNKTEAYKDYFYDHEVATTYKPIKLKLYGGYRNIGPLYSSPTAQTLRIFANNNPDELSLINNSTTNRLATVYDRMTQIGLYNQSIGINLMAYQPIYGNATPYGSATPNRKGITIGLSRDDTASFVKLDAKVQLLSEILAEGTTELRQFNVYQGGVRFDIGRLARMEKQLGLSFGITNENTKRTGPAPVDFKTNLIDAGINIEVLKNVDLLVGAKYLTGVGNELLARRDAFNNILSFNDYIIDSKQTIMTGGVRFRFFKYSYFTVQYNSFNNKDALSTTNNYRWNQVWGNMTIKF